MLKTSASIVREAHLVKELNVPQGYASLIHVDAASQGEASLRV
jgi:hypothetical protein